MYVSSTRSNFLILFIEIVILGIIVSLSYKIYSLNQVLKSGLDNKQNMISLSDELRQSSDDLTHFARTYVVTNNLIYKEQYFTALGIRDGEIPRPDMYETIYWDLEKNTREKRHPKVDKSAIKDRINKLPFTSDEKDLLSLAEYNSNDLVNLEVEAFKLMDFKSTTNDNQILAINMLHSDDYYYAKHKIMDPIDKFMILLTQRIKNEVYVINRTMSRYIVLMILLIIVFVIVNILFYFYLKSKDKKSLQIQRELETRFKDLVESANTWIWEIDTQGVYTYSSHQVKEILGYTADEVIGKTPFDFITANDVDRIQKIYNDTIDKRENIVGLENINIHKNGDKVYLSTSGSPYFDNDGVILGYRGMDTNITNQKILELNLEKKVKLRTKDLEYQAHHDSLTKLPNRILFNDRLEHAIIKAKRNKSKLALLFIDLDHFKEINDSLGHIVGDKVLIEVTEKLNKVIREEDTLSRLGGDEFTIILEDLVHEENPSLLAIKIIEVLTKPITIDNHTLYVSSSIGISLYPEDGDTVQNLLKFADAAMYKAKDEGRNNFQYYSSEMTELALKRIVMETNLRKAIENKEFIVYYQPQVDGETGRLTGMEALIRWQHPTMGIITPSQFISIASSIGVIIELDRFVMKTAMAQMSKWYEDGLNPGRLAMNLSIKHLQKKDFIEVFNNLLKETYCKPEWVELEITESQIMINPEACIGVLNYLSKLGINLAIDDFGTGYSSLSYLKRLPIDKLKIDQSFIRGLPNNKEDVGIVKAVITLAKSLNLSILAEGVENREQKDFLVKHDCKDIQGYLYAKPIPAKELETLFLSTST